MTEQTTAELRVGRLFEVRRVKGFQTVEDVDEMMRLIRPALENIPAGVRVVTVADWRKVSIMSPESATRALEMFRHANPHTERSAMLYTDRSPTAVMQFFRLLRDADNPNRRMFARAKELAAWLSEVLTPPEQDRLHEFLGIDPP